MINSHLLYQLSYRGIDAANFTKIFIQVNALGDSSVKVCSFLTQLSRITMAMALAT